ncbi:MAG: CoA-binding protein [Actinomycetia bacterium]|nr:CoA-binding protein [Actinomycetes bacterium]
MDDLLVEKIEHFRKVKIWAVVGATPRTEKPGYQIYYDLKKAGYKVYPIHPAADELLGEKVYRLLSNLPEVPGVVDFVVPPEVASKIVKEVASLGIKKVWFQPGTESEEALDFCEENNIDYIENACVMKDMLRTK